jgi:ubiquinone biosynthesis protein UbiJ
MDWSGSTVTLAVFLSTQLGVAVWWASETDTKVERNTTTISQVADNATDIAVIQNDVIAIKGMMHQNKKDVEELNRLMNRLLISYSKAAREEE